MIIWLSTYIITNLTDLKSEKLYGVFNDQKERCQMALWIKTYFGRYSWLNKNTTPCTPKNGFWYSLDVILKFSNMFPCHSNAGIFLTYWIMGVWDRKSQEKDCWRGAFVSHIDASVFRGQVVEFIYLKIKGNIKISVISVNCFRVNLKYFTEQNWGPWQIWLIERLTHTETASDFKATCRTPLPIHL